MTSRASKFSKRFTVLYAFISCDDPPLHPWETFGLHKGYSLGHPQNVWRALEGNKYRVLYSESLVSCTLRGSLICRLLYVNRRIFGCFSGRKTTTCNTLNNTQALSFALTTGNLKRWQIPTRGNLPSRGECGECLFLVISLIGGAWTQLDYCRNGGLGSRSLFKTLKPVSYFAFPYIWNIFKEQLFTASAS